MKELLIEILSNIVSLAEEVRVEESEENGYKVFTITVSPVDMARVIGKEGRVIRSVRNVMRVAAIKKNERIIIKLNETQTNPPG